MMLLTMSSTAALADGREDSCFDVKLADRVAERAVGGAERALPAVALLAAPVSCVPLKAKLMSAYAFGSSAALWLIAWKCQLVLPGLRAARWPTSAASLLIAPEC